MKEVLGGKYTNIDRHGRPYRYVDGERFSPVDTMDGRMVWTQDPPVKGFIENPALGDHFKYKSVKITVYEHHGAGRPKGVKNGL